MIVCVHNVLYSTINYIVASFLYIHFQYSLTRQLSAAIEFIQLHFSEAVKSKLESLQATLASVQSRNGLVWVFCQNV